MTAIEQEMLAHLTMYIVFMVWRQNCATSNNNAMAWLLCSSRKPYPLVVVAMVAVVMAALVAATEVAEVDLAGLSMSLWLVSM